MTMARTRRVAGGTANERGSVLIAALMITFVLSLLGIALFDLTALDARLALGSEADHRALELARSAIDRTLYQLLLDLCGGSAACTSPPANPNWADGSINGNAYTVDTGASSPFQNVATWGTAGSPLTGFADTTGFGGIGANVAYTSSYYVQAKALSQTQAGALGVFCTPDGVNNCTDAIYIRATANFRAGNVQSGTRTLQTVVVASFNGFGDGIIVGSPASGSISGNAEIHGSLHIVPCGVATCNPVVFGGGAGMRNNYNALNANRQNFVPRLPQITCAVGTQCAGLVVETLNASVRIAKPDNGDIDIQSGAISIGESGAGTTNPVTNVRGKPTMEGVYLGNGCQTADCSDQVLSRPQNVHSDRPIRGYDMNPAPSFPLLSDQAVIFGRTYDDFAACSGPGVCNVSGVVVSGSGNDFFISHAAKVTSSTLTDAPFVCSTTAGIAASCPAGGTLNLLNLLSGGGGLNWDDSTATWSFTFRCAGASPVACDDDGLVRVNGCIYPTAASANCGTNKPDGFQLEWNNATQTVSVYQCPIGQTGSDICGVPAPCSFPCVPAAVGNLIYGSYSYRVAYVNNAGVEFAVSPPVTITTEKAPGPGGTVSSQLSFVAPVGPTATITRRLYRLSTSDRLYHRVVTYATNTSAETQTDNLVDGTCAGCLADSATHPPLSNEGLLSDVALPTLPIMVYVDGKLKICGNCNNKTFFFRGNAAFLAKGDASDTLANSNTANASVWLDPHFLACPPNAGYTDCANVTDTSSFPQKNLFTFYTPGNIFMGLQSQRDFFGQFYAMGKWTSSKQTNVVGAVTARQFDITAQVPAFWQVRMPRTNTAFPPRGQRWSINSARGLWKECAGATVPTGPC